MINPRGGPLFEQIAADLRADIRAGRIQPGQLLPSETRLHQQYGTSRLTARAAVNVLRAEGLAELIRGRGVVVREPAVLEDLTPPPGSTVVARMPTAEERAAHDIGEGVPVLVVEEPDGTITIHAADERKVRLP